MEGFIYNCPMLCPIRKHCFIVKTESELTEPLIILKKCDAEKGKDIRVRIGGTRKRERPP